MSDVAKRINLSTQSKVLRCGWSYLHFIGTILKE